MMALELDHSTPEAGKLAPCTGTGLLRPDRASVGLSFALSLKSTSSLKNESCSLVVSVVPSKLSTLVSNQFCPEPSLFSVSEHIPLSIYRFFFFVEVVA